MLPYSVMAFISILVLASVHLLAGKMHNTDSAWQGRFLSIGGGIAIAYVFIELLPKLCLGDLVVRQALTGIFPFAERHVYILALLGFLLFFTVDRLQSIPLQQAPFYLSLASYALFNFFMGYAVTYKDDPDIQPLALFIFAMALHYFTNDYTLNRDHRDYYQTYGKWILIGSLFFGWVIGNIVIISPAAIALINAFIGGGVIMNVTRHELPAENPNSTPTFLFGAVVYTLILLTVGTNPASLR